MVIFADMKYPTRLFLLLAGLTALLMSIPFLVPHCGWAALVGWVPLLCLEHIASQTGIRRLWPWHYGTFVLWNAATTFWVCNATVGGGIFAIFANALQMSLLFGLFRLSKKHFRGVVPYLILATAWIAWERWYLTSAQISWPWLVLGNAFARNTGLVQWYEYTGTLGGSLWVWACNLSVFGLMTSLSDGSWQRWNGKARFAAIGGLVALLAAPVAVSMALFARYEAPQETLPVVIAQPNIDPYHKFEALSQEEQNAILEDQFRQALRGRTDSAGNILLLSPETFTNDVIVGYPAESRTWRRFTALQEAYPGTHVMLGASGYTRVESAERPSPNARYLHDNLWYLSHNLAVMAGTGETYLKSKLVVGVEMMPYPKVFRPLDELLGGVMGRCEGQPERTTLSCGDVPLGCAICYESIYGEFCAGYVRAGARALVIITNDAWWGDTPGYRQHLSYACLRAIETRRAIARCANTGISAFIDARGEILSRTSWWQKEILQGEVALEDRQTFFVQNGDIIGRICSLLFILLLAALLVRLLTRR